MFKRAFYLVLMCVIFIGCATPKTKFVYDSPIVDNVLPNNFILAKARVEDERTHRGKIDEIFSSNPIDSLDAIINEEIKSTGLFKDIIKIPYDKQNKIEYLKEINADYVISMSLLKMNWNVPNYEALNTKAFTAGLLTGFVGGIAYGMTNTDVYGDTSLKVVVMEIKSGEKIIDKKYSYRHKEKTTKIKCDSKETKASVIGKSMKKLMAEVKEDLKRQIIMK